MVQQTVPPWEPPETEVVPGSSLRGGEVVVKLGLVPSQRPHSNNTVSCANNFKALRSLHTILLGVGGTIYTAHTLDQFKKLGIDPQRSTKLARKLHAHSVQYAQNLTSTRRAIQTKNTNHNSGALVLHASRNPQTHTSFPLTLR
eukprot:1161679-Pelagomonas_calceolata.AAC.2